MRYLRQNEPRDPELRRIAKVIPDRWLDEQWPQRRHNRQGRWQGLKTSQIVRIHLLVLLKGLGSFNRACHELKYNFDFRRFCRQSIDAPAPTTYLPLLFESVLG